MNENKRCFIRLQNILWRHWPGALFATGFSHICFSFLGIRQQLRFWPRLSDVHVFWSPPAKSSHPKKTGCTTKSTSSTSTSTPRSRGLKDADAAAPNGGKDARANRKSDPPTSSVAQKTPEKSSPRLSHGVSTSSSDREGAQGAESSAASEESRDGGAPAPQGGAPERRDATEDTSCTGGALDGGCGGEEVEEESSKGSSWR